ncbi:MAG TPA: gliding motility-associated C-terminal domain-containing protein [Chitinophagaceae bacterium]|nr:gliding motility-associated C-terminal domain-containing protein [Chitinophagaceae bacterium]
MKKSIFTVLLSLIATVCIKSQPACNPKGDFSFTRNPCSAFDITYATNAAGFTNIRWQFGDGNTASGTISVNHTYATLGNYQVTLIVDYPSCSDTITKTISVAQQTDAQLIQTIDTLLCSGSTKQLRSTAGFVYCWSPTTFLDNPLSPNPITSTTQNITYYLNSLSLGANLITNGDFNLGNTGFTSQYFYTANNTTEGEYYVGNNPSSWYFAHFGCGDHTTGTGNMLLVNGSPQPDAEVWKTTVTVSPNTNYTFSTWICSISVPNPAKLAFSINGNAIGGLITASQPSCNWFQFYTTWNSGNATSAVISIINKNTILFGNDFALDDIFFSPFTFRRDSVKITVDKPAIISSANQTICAGKSVQLNRTGGTSYTWTPATGLSGTAIANPVASPLVTTEYYVTGTNANNCTGKDTVLITVNPLPVITVTADTSICENTSIQLSASGGSTYSWSPTGTLNDASLPNPIASPTLNTKYRVVVTSADGCINSDSVQVDIRTVNRFFADPAGAICLNNSRQLNAGGGDTYSWVPVGSLSNASLPNPIARPAVTTLYTVTITDTVCRTSANLSTTVTVNPLPVVTASKSNDIDCTSNISTLNATGAVSYSWSPGTGLSNTIIADPAANPADTTKYIVTGTDNNGCTNKDSVTVNVSATGKSQYLMPTAFTPNGDGINDCYGIRYWGAIQDLDFSIYNRWGELIFHTTSPSICWDGTYKGVKQDAAVFVYVVRAVTLCGEAYRKGTFALIR